MDAIKVLVVENNAALREGWAQLINGTVGFLCVGDFAHAKDIASLIRRTKPQVVLMDMDFPHDRDGMEALLLIKAAAPDIHVIIQTYCADTITIFQAIKAGASGYLLKTTKPCRLLEAIQDVLMGGSPMTPSITYKILEIIRKSDRTVLFTPPSVSKLTERQKEIVAAIVEEKSYKKIAEELFISLNTVKFHVKHIFEIYQVHSRHQLTALFKAQ